MFGTESYAIWPPAGQAATSSVMEHLIKVILHDCTELLNADLDGCQARVKQDNGMGP